MIDWNMAKIRKLSDLCLRDIVSNRLFNIASSLSIRTHNAAPEWMQLRAKEAIAAHGNYQNNFARERRYGNG